jgi:catechol 2,3-dioxygenase
MNEATPAPKRAATDLPALRLSHMGIFVRDLERMADFYKAVLGFVETDRGPARGQQVIFLTRHPEAHHQLVLSSGRPDSSGPTHALQQMSFMSTSLDDLRRMHALVAARDDVSDIHPVDHGNAWSLYFRDPEDNRIEVYIDSPWHVAQPHHVVLDLSLTDEEIHRQTRARIADDPTFAPMADWHAAQRKKLREAGIPDDQD